MPHKLYSSLLDHSRSRQLVSAISPLAVEASQERPRRIKLQADRDYQTLQRKLLISLGVLLFSKSRKVSRRCRSKGANGNQWRLAVRFVLTLILNSLVVPASPPSKFGMRCTVQGQDQQKEHLPGLSTHSFCACVYNTRTIKFVRKSLANFRADSS